jgi:hypothetical protein
MLNLEREARLRTEGKAGREHRNRLISSSIWQFYRVGKEDKLTEWTLMAFKEGISPISIGNLSYLPW